MRSRLLSRNAQLYRTCLAIRVVAYSKVACAVISSHYSQWARTYYTSLGLCPSLSVATSTLNSYNLPLCGYIIKYRAEHLLDAILCPSRVVTAWGLAHSTSPTNNQSPTLASGVIPACEGSFNPQNLHSARAAFKTPSLPR